MTPTILIIPLASIEVLNPRVRNRKVFEEMVESIRAVGLKRPITVRKAPEGDGYELICGQGRMEAFAKLGQTDIPAMVIQATRDECFVMSLVENLARRNLTPLELIREVGVLRERGYNNSEIAKKIGFSPEYVWTINFLLEKGEERLLDAVERGVIPHTIAAEIARADDAGVQRGLTEAYEKGSLPGDQILAIRRIVDERNLMGKGIRSLGNSRAKTQPTSAAALVRAYQKEVERQKLLVKTATLTESRLTFIVGAMAKLLSEEHSSRFCARRGWPGFHSRSPSGSAERSCKMSAPVRISFAQEVIELPLTAILPLRPMTTRITESRRYGRVLASIGQVGVIEPLAVTTADTEGRHMLLDGHLRLHALAATGAANAPCIVSDDDEAFTYNKRVNRLATVQEHYMISRALDRGVPAAMIAAALGLDEKAITRRRNLLDGIAPEAVDILKDRQVNPLVFDILRKLKPHKQFGAAEMMVSMNNFTGSYAKAILAATRQEDLAKPEQPKKIAGVTADQMRRMERELETLNVDYRARETTFGEDVLQLVLSSRYLERLIANENVARYLGSRHADILSQFQTIVAASSLDPG